MNIAMLFLSVFTFIELNCENLFDCVHDSLKQDIEFTPEGARKWTPRKYYNKVNNIVKTITAIGEDGNKWTLPDMIALCEVENDSTMHTLTRRSPLRSLGYEYVMTSSPDVRGIDVALLWHPGSFAMINHHAVRVKPIEGMRHTRDILYVSGRLRNGDTLHVIVAHAPSRYGGIKRTEPHRMLVSDRIAGVVDSIKTVSRNPRIIVAGDFNDYHNSPVVVNLKSKGLVNVSEKAKGTNGAKGTYKYKGAWNSIDHILVNAALSHWVRSCFVFDAPFLLEEDTRYGGVKPFRTSNGYRYQNGFSDHLPLVMKLEIPPANKED